MWNADGLSTKVQERRDRLAAETIDVCLIQDTKLAKKDISPPLPGYNSIRFGRPSTHQGVGLLTLVKEGIVFQFATEDYDLLPEGTNATDKASTPKARSPRPARAKDYACGYRRYTARGGYTRHHAVV